MPMTAIVMKSPDGKKYSVMGSLPRLQRLLLPGHISHNQWNRGQMTGTEKDADHPP